MKCKSFLLKAICIVLLTLPKAMANFQYMSAEHMFIGDDITLSFPDKKISGSNFTFQLKNGSKLSYGDLVAMPDYYGVPGQAISSALTDEEKIKRFNIAFTQMDSDENFSALNAIIQDEKRQVEQALKQGADPQKVYSDLGFKESMAIAQATNYRSIQLALVCYDHFRKDALTAYSIGHRIAVKEAISAYYVVHNLPGKNNKASSIIAQCYQQKNTNDCLIDSANTMLRKAYAFNAFASHFLTDRFAAGHIRTPLREVHDHAIPMGVVGSRAANLMHNEDNTQGVIVKNALGEEWVAYGDTMYFGDANKENKAQLAKVMQKSADEIYQAFLQGRDTDPASAQLFLSVPYALPPQTKLNDRVQTEPLFSMIGDTVFVRASVCHPNDFSKPKSVWTAAQVISDSGNC